VEFRRDLRFWQNEDFMKWQQSLTQESKVAVRLLRGNWGIRDQNAYKPCITRTDAGAGNSSSFCGLRKRSLSEDLPIHSQLPDPSPVRYNLKFR
jgi:hypothetical protein